MTETPLNGLHAAQQASQGELARLLVSVQQFENLILFTALAQDWPDEALEVVEDKLDRLLTLVRARRG